MTEFADLIYDIGLSTKGVARLLDVREDTIRNWKHGKRTVPDRVMEQIRELNSVCSDIFDEKEKQNE